MPDSFDSFCSIWPGADPGGRMKGMHPPINHFQHFFDVGYTNFPQFRTSLRAISLTLYARIIENVRTKCFVFAEALRIMVKKFKPNLRAIIKKAL